MSKNFSQNPKLNQLEKSGKDSKMIMRRMNITGLLLLTLIPFYIPELSAQTQIGERETLRGLKGTLVVIEELHDDIIQAGLTRSILQTDVELKLRKAGIRVLTEDEWLFTPGFPYLYVNVNAFAKTPTCGFIYSVSVAFKQRVALSRNRSITTRSGITWHNTFLGFNPKLHRVREIVSDLVDKFLNDYLAVNPK